MPLLIPIAREADGSSWFDLQAVIEDVTYTLEFRWNVRASAWFMHVADADGEVAHQVGVRLVADYPLSLYRPDRQPSGLFVLIDTQGAESGGEEPGFDDLGNRHQLYYYTVSELAG